MSPPPMTFCWCSRRIDVWSMICWVAERVWENVTGMVGVVGEIMDVFVLPTEGEVVRELWAV